MSSQTCVIYFGRFYRRYKVNQDCRPEERAMLPEIIATQRSRRTLQVLREDRLINVKWRKFSIETKVVTKGWPQNHEPGNAVN